MRSFQAMLVLAVLAFIGVPADAASQVYIAASTPAQVKLPDDIRRIAVVEFTAKESSGRSYAAVAAGRLSSVLAAAPESSFQLLDRTHLKGVLAEQDLGAAGITDSDTAIKAGKMLNVDAIIFGSVHVETNEEFSESSAGGVVSRIVPLGGRKSSLRRSALVNVTFNMVHPETGEQLVTRSISHSYDSAAPSGGGAGGALKKVFGGKSPPSSEAIVNGLIEQCVADFAGLLVPHSDILEYSLASSKGTKTGNAFAEGGDLKTAASQYKTAVEADPKDAAAVFNLAIATLALNDPQGALELLDKAVVLKTDKKWIRVRQDLAEILKAEAVQFRPATNREIAAYKSSLKAK